MLVMAPKGRIVLVLLDIVCTEDVLARSACSECHGTSSGVHSLLTLCCAVLYSVVLCL